MKKKGGAERTKRKLPSCAVFPTLRAKSYIMNTQGWLTKERKMQNGKSND